MTVDVMTLGSDEKEHKLCELVLTKQDLLRLPSEARPLSPSLAWTILQCPTILAGQQRRRLSTVSPGVPVLNCADGNKVREAV